MNEQTIDKYLNGIVAINSSLGRLDSLRIHLKENNDLHAITVIDAVMKDLAIACGTNFHSINIDNIKKVQTSVSQGACPLSLPNGNFETGVKNVSEIKYTQEENIAPKNEKIVSKCNENKNDFANAILNVKKDDNIRRIDFVNSTNLKWAEYNKKNGDLTVQFQNYRTYVYKKVPEPIVDNLQFINERGERVGWYFNQEIVKKWKKNKYIEITADSLIG